MGFKKYIVFSVIFIVAVYAYLFSLELGDYRASFVEISVNLPIAVWVVLPLVIFFIATVLHIMFYGLINAFKIRSINKDEDSMLDMIKASLVSKPYTKKFKTKGFKNLSSILSQFNLSVGDNTFSSSDDDLNNMVAKIQDIKNGKYVADKYLKLTDVSSLANLNILNKVNEQIDFAVEVLKKPENYSPNIVKQAFENVLNEKTMTTIKKVYKNVKLDKDLAQKLFKKDAQNNEFGFETEEILKIVKDVEFNEADFLELARTYESILQPDQIIQLFETLSTEVEKATPAYLHVLCEFEMIDKVKEILATSNEEEFSAFKALLDLKDAGKNYNLEAISYK